MALINLMQVFEKLFHDGYCEEDILDAFIASLEQARIATDDTYEAMLLQKRIDALQSIAEEWIVQNNEEMGNYEPD